MPRESKKKVSSSRQHNLAVGTAGERRVVAYLQARGYQVVAQNVRLGQDELDVVAFDPHHQETVFVEVKTRQSATVGEPIVALDRRKLRAFTRAGQRYVRQFRVATDFRFDVASVLPGQIDYFENITFP